MIDHKQNESNGNGNGNGRLREPSFRELVAELDGFKDVMNEREKRYDERFLSQERAITKAETAQNAYNVVHNDLIRKNEAQYKEMVPILRFDDFKKDLEDYKKAQAVETISLRLARSQVEGRSQGVSAVWGVIIAVIGILIGSGLASILIRAVSK